MTCAEGFTNTSAKIDVMRLLCGHLDFFDKEMMAGEVLVPSSLQWTGYILRTLVQSPLSSFYLYFLLRLKGRLRG